MKYLLFDLDGTLLNTRDGIVMSIQYSIAQYGIHIDDLTLLERHIGPPLKEGFIHYYHFDDKTADSVVMTFRKKYKEIGLKGTHPYEGIENCLKELQEAGYHLMVATSKPDKVAKIFLEHFKLAQYFEDICGSIEEEEEARVTKADVIECILKRNHIDDRNQAIMIGDRYHDVEGAKQCHIDCLGILHGFGSKEELLEAGALAIVRDSQSLLEYIMNRG